MDSVMKGLTGAIPPPQNFWARTAPKGHLSTLKLTYCVAAMLHAQMPQKDLHKI